MRRVSCLVLVIAGFGFDGCSRTSTSEADLKACEEMVAQGFQGKVQQATALCRGGARAAQFMKTPWLDWTNYWATADAASKAARSVGPLGPDGRGIDGALLDLEYERIELIKFNLFDNSGAYEQYVKGRDGVGGPALKTWKEMRLPPGHANYRDVGGDGNQVCQSELIRSRTLTGICNDIRNPLMGSTGQLFARNVEFDITFPELGRTA